MNGISVRVPVLLSVFCLLTVSASFGAQGFEPCRDFRAQYYTPRSASTNVLTGPWIIRPNIANLLDALGLGGSTSNTFRDVRVVDRPGTRQICAGRDQDGSWFIVADTDWLGSVTVWQRYMLLAHEIGHILLDHPFVSGRVNSEAEFELAADSFAGRALFHMGASLQEVLTAASELFGAVGRGMYPARATRIAALEDGWRKAWRRAQATLAAARETEWLAPPAGPVGLDAEALARAELLPLTDDLGVRNGFYYHATGRLDRDRVFRLAIPDGVESISVDALRLDAGEFRTIAPLVFHQRLAECANRGWVAAPGFFLPVSHYVNDRRRELVYVAIPTSPEDNSATFQLSVFADPNRYGMGIEDEDLELHDCGDPGAGGD